MNCNLKTHAPRPNAAFAFACVAICLGFLILPGCSQKIDTPAEFREAAYLHESRGEFEEAVASYKRALELDEDSATIWYDMGVAYASMEKYDDAIKAYSEAVRLDENMERAYNNRAAAYAQKDMLKEAIADCDQAIKLDPNDQLAWRNRGLAHHDLGNFNQAILDYDASLRLDGQSAITYLHRGNVYLETKSFTRALEDFHHALALDDGLASAWLSKAKAYREIGNSLEAESAAAKAKELGADIAELAEETAAAPPPPNAQQSAVAFVRQRLTKAKAKISPSFRPWHFDAEDESGTQHILVAVANDKGVAEMSFNKVGLETLKSSQIPTTLYLVQRIVGPAPAGEPEAEFQVLEQTANWTPSDTSLQPIMWNMSIGGAVEETVTER